MRKRFSVFAGRPHPDGYARQAGDRFDDAIELRRPEHPSELAKARDKIGDPHLAAMAIGEHGGDDGGIAHIFGMKFRHVVEHDVGKSLFFLSRNEPAEDRIAVKARIAPPDQSRAWIDQCGRSAVPDDRKVQPVICHPAVPRPSGRNAREPRAYGFGRVEMAVDIGNDPADGKA